VPTTIHIPDALLAEVDKRAKALWLSRNRFILTALEKALAAERGWSPGFIDAVRGFEPIDEERSLWTAIEGARRSKRGELLEDMDIAIAAHAIAWDLRLVSNGCGRMRSLRSARSSVT
jgi:predicted nucleic acid-binding protein